MSNLRRLPMTFRFMRDKRAAISPLIGSVLLLIACGGKDQRSAAIENANSSSAGAASTAIDAGPIIERYRRLDDARDSTTNLRASISDRGEGAGLEGSRSIQFNMYRKNQPDGRKLILIEFTVPPEERDRDGLITAFPDGQVEGVRYVQSTDSFIVTRDLMGEDAMFGMTMQELADGQPEKYDFAIIGEETVNGTPCYRAEGKLKQGAESKFHRVVLLISKESSAAVQAKFYDNRGELARDLVVHKSEQIDGHWTRMRWTIDNLARRKKIDFEVANVSYDRDLKDSIFTREHLKKIASR